MPIVDPTWEALVEAILLKEEVRLPGDDDLFPSWRRYGESRSRRLVLLSNEAVASFFVKTLGFSNASYVVVEYPDVRREQAYEFFLAHRSSIDTARWYGGATLRDLATFEDLRRAAALSEIDLSYCGVSDTLLAEIGVDPAQVSRPFDDAEEGTLLHAVLSQSDGLVAALGTRVLAELQAGRQIEPIAITGAEHRKVPRMDRAVV